ncbi:MAG TPA: response regulator [Polaromonas sp.]|uniref:sensor histidine kinase n=1 Tax=Polaromonas sp. TaxID=1869339 RepID=UPI002D3AC36F|nr:response regulator [Polaromonas sp.]HYW56613.1 response regulator [Polaromonas sp.]
MNPEPATILIVDDEPTNCKLLQALLQPEGYLTMTAGSGAQAIDMVAESPPDLILLDVMMPEMDGYQLAAKLKADSASSDIPIIMVTALSDRSARLAGLDAGAEEFLTKPVDRAELSLRVRNLLRLKEYANFLKNQSHVLEDQVRARTIDLQRFRTAMDATADAIFLTSRKTMRFVEVNATACRMFGYTREEMFAIDPQMLNNINEERLAAVYDEVIAGHEADTLQLMRIAHKDGFSVQVEIQRQAHRSGDDWIIVSVVRDITERMRAQDEILRLNLELEARVEQRTEQLQVAIRELEAFSYSASHDLRTPLSTINGFCSLLGKELGDAQLTERSKHYLDRIRVGAGQMGLLIDALLSLAQVSRRRINWSEVDVSAMAQAILLPYQELEPERVLKLDIQDGLHAQADAHLLRLVLGNLLGNAWKFSSKKPQTDIRFFGETGPNGETIYTLQDKGAGFDMAYYDKLFGAFHRLHSVEEFAGTGVGLVTVHRIITRHGGCVWAESTVGQGASFHFTLGTPQD